VDFPFDGETLRIQATFAPEAEVLIGTNLLRPYRIEIDFVRATVLLAKA